MKQIGRMELQVNNWVQFQATQDQLKHASEKRKAIHNQFYLVVTRSDRYLDKCRCLLMDMAGNTHDYCAKTSMFDYDQSLNGKIWVADVGEVESIYGSEKVRAIYDAARLERQSIDLLASSL